MSCNCNSGCGCHVCEGGGCCACACATAMLAGPRNGPGRTSIDVRLGDYGDFFLDAMERLGRAPALKQLATRRPDDFSIAWLDAWAVGADVITFYRDRLTNESYLRTAADERALRELAALVGFKPRPGVAATGHLAYLLDRTAAPVEIPARAKAQTVPRPGEDMQTFETDEALSARVEWNDLTPRRTRPALLNIFEALTRDTIPLAGISTLVRPGDRLLLVFGPGLLQQVVREVRSVTTDALATRTDLALKPKARLETISDEAAALLGRAQRAEVDPRDPQVISVQDYLLGGTGIREEERMSAPGERTTPRNLFAALTVAAPRQLRSGRRLGREVGAFVADDNDGALRLARSLVPGLRDALFKSWSQVSVTGRLPALQGAFIFRVACAPFGAVAPKSYRRDHDTVLESGEYGLALEDTGLAGETAEGDRFPRNIMYLDSAYDTVSAGQYVVYRAGGLDARPVWRIARIRSADIAGRSAYTLSSKVTQLLTEPLDRLPVWGKKTTADSRLSVLRRVVILAAPEAVQLAPETVTDTLHGGFIELEGLYPELDSGRWIIITGERADMLDANEQPIPGIMAGELAMVADVKHNPNSSYPGDTPHTLLYLVKPLAYSYVRATVKIYGNVVAASHGESVTEIVGSGDATRTDQKFTLKRAPLTFTPAATESGVQSSEIARVYGSRYHEVPSLLDVSSGEHAYEIDLDAHGAATLSFSRLPTGQQNVRATYRVGLGVAGNAVAEQISLPTTRPLGVTAVLNPLAASGGADRDKPELIRRNAPIAAQALAPHARLVSVEDYASLARRFAGIGHAQATRIMDGMEELVYVTVAGVDDVALDPEGELLTNLARAFEAFGDPSYPVHIGVRELMALKLQAKVALVEEASWDVVEPLLRSRLLDLFSFDRRGLGRSAYLSEAIAVMQATPGVDWVDVDLFGSMTAAEVFATAQPAVQDTPDPLSPAVLAKPARVNPDWMPNTGAARVLPAQLAYMLPNVAGLLALNLSK